MYSHWIKGLRKDGLPPEQWTAILTILDGLWWARFFGLYTFSRPETAALHRTLTLLVKGNSL
jgi:hypothetical protein